MAKVLRQDTKQLLGYLIELDGPIQPWIKEWPFRAWHHPDGKLRDFPPVPTDGRMLVPPHLELGIPIRTSPSGELEILVPPHFLDFIRHHSAFRPLSNAGL
jgi:hypothetical protein